GGRRCLTHQLWTDLSRQIFTFLEGITLAQFVDRPMISEINAHHRHHTRRRDRIQPIRLPAVV
ncbi:MAG TPA: hypothetical protein P5330_12080, partial [Candidatus Competibacteraceae bacterium]|nr:hypothetical protein [Candidatus Competibacteraceae bacterium]